MNIKDRIQSLSLKKRTIFFLVALTSITLTTLGVVIFSSWINSAHKATEELSIKTHAEVDYQVSSFFNNPFELNHFNDVLIKNGYVDMMDQEERERFFVLALLQYDNQVYSLGYGTITGEYYGARRAEGDVIEIMRNNASTGGQSWYYSVSEDLTALERVVAAGVFDARLRPWYLSAASVGETTFSPVYQHFIMDDLAFSLSTPIYDTSGELKGVIAAHMILSKINNFLFHSLLESNGMGVIIDKNTHELIANSSGDANYNKLPDNSVHRLTIDEFSRPNFSVAYDYYLTSNETNFYLNNNRTNDYFTISEIEENGIHWVVITSTPRSDLFVSIYNNIMWMVAISIVSILLLIYFYNLYITKAFYPIQNLVEVTDQYASGDFSARAKIYHDNELGKLASSYNFMAIKIADFVNNLEVMVKERTHKLETLNVSLRESEERFKILHNASFGGIAVHDKGFILDCNQGLSNITGYAIDELIGMNGLLLVAPDYRDFVMGNIVSGYEKPYEAYGIRKNQEIYPLKLEARMIPYEGRQIRVVEFRDLSDYKEQETARIESEEKFKLLHDTMIQGVVYQNGDGHITSCNPAAEKILGMRFNQMQGVSSMDPRWKLIDEAGNLVPGEKHPAMIALKTKTKVGPLVYGMYHPLRETYVWLSIVAIPLFKDGEEAPYQVYATLEEITEIRNASIELKESKEKLELILDNLPIGIAVNSVEPSVKFDYMNDNFSAIYGVDKNDLIKEDNFWEAVYENKHFREQLKEKVLADIASKDPKRMVWKDVPIQKKGKETRFVNAYATPLPKSNLLVSSVIDVSDRKRREDEIIYVSNHDYLTRIPNRRYYQEKLFEYDQDKYYPLGVVIMDMNGLKLINDAFGHESGNEALEKIAIVLDDLRRDNDFVARIGGDEFAMICPNCNEESMEKLIESIDKCVGKNRVKEIALSLAIGYDIKTHANEPIRDVLTNAENNMYKNKVLNGNNTRNDAIHSILQTLQDKFEEEKVHSIRVSRYCKMMGEVMHLRRDEIKELEIAGLFHDIGKISIPDAILKKESKLSQEEWDIMKNHTLNGYQILRAADRYSNLAEYAMSHHERIDGRGYPNGIAGDQIPLFSRIISVADAFEAMTSNRPYRKAIPQEEAIKELEKYAGTQFDAEIVNIFVHQVLPKE